MDDGAWWPLTWKVQFTRVKSVTIHFKTGRRASVTQAPDEIGYLVFINEGHPQRIEDELSLRCWLMNQSTKGPDE